ncbi:UxaA family hydrolase [Metabacillus halosaccharovorans]|uniref:UxaA family hydrolase n=1 Tax=Metabacillus halosaccharovorans TaxID=930124 RepID=UPI00203FE3F0|nr:UxaA family hydrolase [Metabacillus halosaccharovorans]MCM3439378.1 UxaA family hydrolase [Metabacillus halosaccharovorans]
MGEEANSNNRRFVVLHPTDNVAVALDKICIGEKVNVKQNVNVQLKNIIEFGHKFAIKNIEQGQFIIKYGEVIGKASKMIDAGEHVHIQNVEGNRGRGDKIEHT